MLIRNGAGPGRGALSGSLACGRRTDPSPSSNKHNHLPPPSQPLVTIPIDFVDLVETCSPSKEETKTVVFGLAFSGAWNSDRGQASGPRGGRLGRLVFFHAQSSGRVERMNIHHQGEKAMMRTGLKWPEARLLCAIFSLQHTNHPDRARPSRGVKGWAYVLRV